MRKKSYGAINIVFLDVQEDGILQDDELDASIRTKKKALRMVQDGESEVV